MSGPSLRVVSGDGLPERDHVIISRGDDGFIEVQTTCDESDTSNLISTAFVALHLPRILRDERGA